MTQGSPSKRYKTAAIRNLLMSAFSDIKFVHFCYDYYREVHNQFASGTGFDEKVQRLIEYCETRGLFDTLLSQVKGVSPRQYEVHAPYDEIDLTSGQAGGQGRSSSAVPHNSPPYPENFVFRQQYIDQIVNALLDQNRFVGIFGMPGSGKTSLARMVFHRIQDRFVDNGYSSYWVKDKDSSAVISMIASDFGTPMPDNWDLDTKKLNLRSLLAGRRALILLLGVERTQVVQDLLEIAPACRFIITSTTHILPEKLYYVTLDSMSDNEAVELFLRVRGKESYKYGEEADIRKLCLMLGNLPLAIEIMASRVKISGMALGDVVKSLGSSPQKLLQALYNTDHSRSVSSSFLFSFNALDEIDQRLFTSLGVFEGDDFSLEAVKAVSGLDDVDWRLGDLVSLSLVQKAHQAPSRFALHPLLKSFANVMMTDRDAYCQRQASYFFNYAWPNRHPIDRLDPDVNNILGCLPWCQKQMSQRGDESLVQFLVDLLGVGVLEAAQMTYLLARLFKRRSDLDNALAFYDACLQAARSIGAKALEGACLRSLGEIHLNYKSDGPRGLQYIREALDTLDAANDVQSKKEQIYTLTLLMKYYQDIPSIKNLAEQSLVVLRKIPREQRLPSEGLYYAIERLFDTYRKDEAIQEAYEFLEHERDNLAEVGLASVFGHLGRMKRDANEFADAESLFEQAFALYESVNNLGGCAWIKTGLGEMYRRQGYQERAIQCQKEAWQLRQRAGETHLTAVALIDLVRIYFVTGHLAEAKMHWQEFVNQYADVDAPDTEKAYIAGAVTDLGKTLAGLGAGDLVADIFTMAVQLYEQAHNLEGVASVKQSLIDYRQAGGEVHRPSVLDDGTGSLRGQS